MQRQSITFVFLVWLAATAPAQVLVHTSQRTADQLPPRQSTVMAASTFEFLNSIGVACHLNYTWTPYKDAQATTALLVASGIRNIRDGGANPLAVKRLSEVRASGIAVTWVMDPADGVAPNAAYWTSPEHYTLINFLRNVLGPVSSVEVSNEIDTAHANKRWRPNDSASLSDDPASNNFWANYILALTRDTSSVLRADPALSSVRLLGPSFGGPSAGVPNGSLYSLVDMGTFHPYMYRGNPAAPTGIAYDGVPSYFVQSTQPTVYIDEYPTAFHDFQGPYESGGKRKTMVATETGYYTGVSQYSISERAHAKYVPRLFAEFFRHGIAQTFLYEFLDEGNDGGLEHSFGLVRADLTPKPAYTALQSLIALLAGGQEQFKPGKLTYGFEPEISGSFTRTQYAHDLLLEQSDGDFFLLFWHEISDANRADRLGTAVTGTDLDVTPPPLAVNVTLPDQIVKATLYTYDRQWKLRPEVLAIRSHRVSVSARDQLSVLRLSSHAADVPVPSQGRRR